MVAPMMFGTRRARTGVLGVAGVVAAMLLLGASATLGACGNDAAAEAGEEAGPVDASRKDGSRYDGGVDPESDAGPSVPSDVASCNALKAYYQACGGEPLCPLASFDTWCPANTKAVDSEAYRHGTIACSTEANCSADKRKDCMYRSYAGETQTTAQQILTKAFCDMCQPGDVAACIKRTTTYDTVAGPKGVRSEFIAVWELSDAVVDNIRSNCTGTGGGAYDAGADAGACATAFDKCAGDYYVNAFLDCPK